MKETSELVQTILFLNPHAQTNNLLPFLGKSAQLHFLLLYNLNTNLWPLSHLTSEPPTNEANLGSLRPRSRWGHICVPTSIFFCPSPMKIHWSMWIHWSFVHISTIWGQWPHMNPRWSLSWGYICAYASISFCLSPMKIHQSKWI